MQSLENLKPYTLLQVTLVAVYAVLFHWQIWQLGIYALGFNLTLFWLAVLYLAWDNHSANNFLENSSLNNQQQQLSLRRDWYWLVPILLIAVSFSLFENPWLKIISCFLLPVAIAFFYAYSQIQNPSIYAWNFDFFNEQINRIVLPLQCLIPTIRLLRNKSHSLISDLSGESADGSAKHLGKRIGVGVLYLIPAAALVMLLLSSADARFAQLLEAISLRLFGNFNWTAFGKLLWIIVFSIGLLASVLVWRTPRQYDGLKSAGHQSNQSLDSVVAAIVMVGIIAIYVLFLALQVEHLLIAILPIDFSQAEHLVKSGFWQLFFLSILNVMLFFVVYKNTSQFAQVILRIFIVASSLLLLSAAWKMCLYIYYYGLSYEKFFAGYTTLFSLLIFVYLLHASFQKQRKNSLRYIAFAALWAYGIATVLPIEKIIVHSNIQLAKTDDTRIELWHLRDLSVDALQDIKAWQKQLSTVPTTPNTRQSTAMDLQWQKWLLDKAENDCQRPRAWYEKSISLLINCNTNK